MKIIHIITRFSLGGAHVVAYDLATRQVAQGHNAIIIVLRRPPGNQKNYAACMLDGLDKKNVPTIDLSGYDFRFSIPIILFKLVRVLQRERPDIMHLHADPAEFIGSLASRITKTNVVRTIHNITIWPTHFIMGWIAEHAFQNETVVTISKETMFSYESMRKRFGLTPTENRIIVHNGVPIPKKAPRPKITNNLNLAFFGRNTPQKGINTLAEALEKLTSRKHVHLNFDLYSNIQPKNFFISPTNRIKITVHPPTPKARRLMAKYDLLVVPSYFEGLGLVPLESMAVGTPVLMTNAPGLRELTPEGWPLIIPIKDPIALANMIEEVCLGKYNLIDLSKKSRAQAKKFNIECQVEQYINIYKDIIKKTAQ